MFQIQVKIQMAPGRYEWKSIRPTGGQPYTFPTKEAASKMLRMCYPDEPRENVRVIEA
jgi:hypothetical protein